MHPTPCLAAPPPHPRPRAPWHARLLALLAGLLAALCLHPAAWALTAAQALDMATGETDTRAQAITRAAQDADERTRAFIDALVADQVKANAQAAFVMQGDQATDPVTGAAVSLPADAEDVINSNYLRGVLEAAQAALSLQSPDAAQRLQAATALMREPDAERLPLIERALAAETDPAVRQRLGLARASIQLGSGDAAQRLQAAQTLGAAGDPDLQAALRAQLAQEPDLAVQAALKSAVARIDDSLAWGERLGVLFTGLSLGSILLLAALGLAITYGLMGVINMAHGELIMIGAYATYVVQGLFQRHLPESAFGWYLAAAVPVAFAASAAVGALLERGVIRHLYGRPLETLLATWGISLILMQAVRSLFGAQNVGVENPGWMSGGWQVLPNLTLPYNRLAIIVFAAVVLAGVAWLIGRTRLGLFVRAVTQNRPMAACTGVNTARVDTQAFALGSGLAGLAGCALSQVGNVGPDLGQAYIVDSFMVVVLGGVGQLAGTVVAALGLGMAAKLLEGWTGAVLAKIAVLVFIIVFIQKRPQGIFALKGRQA